MDDGILRALKLLSLLFVVGVFAVAGLWVYLVLGLVLGLAGPLFGVIGILYVGNDVYTAITA